MKTALIPNTLVTGVAYYARASWRRAVWHDLVPPEPPVSICPQTCSCPHHWPQVDPWHGCPLLPPRRRIGGAS